MVVKLFGCSYASCSRRVLACLIEKDIESETLSIDINKREQKKPEFLALQPFGKVPVVQDGSLMLFDSRAIIRYYAEKFAGEGTCLLGKTLEERAFIDVTVIAFAWSSTSAITGCEAFWLLVIGLSSGARVAFFNIYS
ncbi:hypothetical protein SUGI_1122230 [Cryptomeria japonica]|nr:hypothetical protein SUGI_1122230 [Cryptomeria japonica]